MSEQPLTYESVLELIREISRETREISRETREISRETREMSREAKERGREFDQRMKEYERQKKETDRRMKETDRIIGKLGGRIGDIVEHMVQENIVDKFRKFGYKINRLSRNAEFLGPDGNVLGEIDLLLVDGNTDILIEVRTKLEITDVQEHIEKMEKYRHYINTKEYTDGMEGEKNKRFVGAVAGAVVRENAMDFAHKKGMYVIVQSGEAVEIAPLPKNFKVKEW
jgi:hypothetical protein